MILCDKDIKKILGKELLIEPFNNEQVSSSSLDLRLGHEFRIFKHTGRTHIDPRDKTPSDEYTELHHIEEDKPFTIHPGEFVLATTHEKVNMPSNIVGSIDGRSSLGRLG
ncbi:MAG TPA: dCTP deaminase, partial [Candidatus Nanoarchaeia archaeon]|nr:dCTP deaminase [Candidatus Nanoarchaeia archaeon]